jgi:hypothetical protein
MTRRIWAIGIVAALAVSWVASGADELPLPRTLTVAAGQRERVDALVQFPLPKEIAERPWLKLRLVETTSGKETPVAVQWHEKERRLWWVAGGTTAAGAKRTYRLELGEAAKFPVVDVRLEGGQIEATFDTKPLLRYAMLHVEPPAGVNPRYGRSGHLHPVWTPGGAIVTDEFPPDHLHQSGIFLAFTKTEFKGHEVDFWNLAGGKGRVRNAGYRELASGCVFGEIGVDHQHVDLTQAEETVGEGARIGGEKALNEVWTMRVWPAGMSAGYWLLDIDSRLTCAGDAPLKFPEYHYGGMAIRAAREWKPEQVRFLTSKGDDRLKGNHTRPQWCRVSGAVAGKQAGVTLMTHPSNFRFPEPLRIHPTMPYMVYTPSFLGDWEIKPGAPHVSRYRFVIHDGDLSAEKLDQLWQDYAETLTAVAP